MKEFLISDFVDLGNDDGKTSTAFGHISSTVLKAGVSAKNVAFSKPKPIRVKALFEHCTERLRFLRHKILAQYAEDHPLHESLVRFLDSPFRNAKPDASFDSQMADIRHAACGSLAFVCNGFIGFVCCIRLACFFIRLICFGPFLFQQQSAVVCFLLYFDEKAPETQTFARSS